MKSRSAKSETVSLSKVNSTAVFVPNIRQGIRTAELSEGARRGMGEELKRIFAGVSLPAKYQQGTYVNVFMRTRNLFFMFRFLAT
jgi:hypothetical protein